MLPEARIGWTRSVDPLIDLAHFVDETVAPRSLCSNLLLSKSDGRFYLAETPDWPYCKVCLRVLREGKRGANARKVVGL